MFSNVYVRRLLLSYTGSNVKPLQVFFRQTTNENTYNKQVEFEFLYFYQDHDTCSHIQNKDNIGKALLAESRNY